MTTTTTTTTNESTPSSSDRLAAEISLLEAMYPDSVTFNRKSLELTYRIMGQYSQPIRSKRTDANDPTTGSGGVLVLRLPSTYPDDGGGGGVPELISACDGTKRDVRDSTRRAIAELNLEGGVEVLDQILATFEGVVSLSSSDSRVSGSSSTANPNHIDSSSETITDRDHDDDNNDNNNNDDDGVDTSGNGTPELKLSPPSKTVIIWLHHLLATSKRKLALSPSVVNSNSNSNTTTTATISGMTKPGYPGVFIFSGPRDLVDSHVKELKSLNWQAFSKRYDSDEATNGLFSSSNTIEIVDDTTTKPKPTKRKQNVSAADDGEWPFTHGRNKIVEVESMAELVKGIVEEHHRDIFLRAVGVK